MTTTVLGVLVLVAKGSIVAAHAVGAYPTIAECTAAVHAAAPPASELPAGSQLGYMCADLSANIADMDKVPAAKPAPKAVPAPTPAAKPESTDL